MHDTAIRPPPDAAAGAAANTGPDAARGPAPPRPFGRIELYGGLLATSIACFTVATLFADRGGWLLALVAPLGGTTCGWSWLFARRLFRADATHDGWALGVVLTLAASHLLLTLGAATSVADGAFAGIGRFALNLNGLASNAVLFLAMAEAMRGYARSLPAPERRLRELFLAVYGGLVLVAVLWVDGAGPDTVAGQARDPVRLLGAWIAVAGGALALRYRRRHPLNSPPYPLPRRRRGVSSAPPAGDAELAARVNAVLEDEAVYTQPELKVADVARMLGEHDYRVTRCITGVLGYPNFNRLLNAQRLAKARQRLSDPALRHRPIASIAFDCGFGSIGSFNRVFKAELGMTPSAFRRAQSGEEGARVGPD